MMVVTYSGGCMMRRIIGLLVVVLLVAGCSGGPLAVEFSHPQEQGLIPFAATGPAVEQADVCDAGMMEIVSLESVEGDPITDEDWATIFDAAMANGGVAEMYVMADYSCDDGSGTFVMRFHNRIDFATFEFEGQQAVGTWEIDTGTADYAGLTGSGNATLDWDSEEAIYEGELDAG